MSKILGVTVAFAFLSLVGCGYPQFQDTSSNLNDAYGPDFSRHRGRTNVYFCQNSVMLINGRSAQDFTFRMDCEKAVQQAQTTQGYFCKDGELFRDERFITDFTFGMYCRAALDQIRGQLGAPGRFPSRSNVYFCNDGVMFVNDIAGPDFDFKMYCEEGIKQAQSNRGYFCRQSDLFRSLELVSHFDFKFECEQALASVVRQNPWGR